MTASLRTNISDKQQGDIENAADDSAIRVFNTDGEVASLPANDLQRNTAAKLGSPAVKLQSHFIGSWDDVSWGNAIYTQNNS